jgi:hypothetical protein
MRPERETQQRIEWLGRAVTALGERPEVLGSLEEHLSQDDVKGFAETLLGHWREYDLQPPADKCDPYVTGYIGTIQVEPEYVCTWIGPVTISTGDGQPQDLSGTPEQILQILIQLGLVECHWVLKKTSDIKVVKKFVGGICPPGTY